MRLRTGRDRSMTILQFSATKAFSRRDANLLQHPARQQAPSAGVAREDRQARNSNWAKDTHGPASG